MSSFKTAMICLDTADHAQRAIRDLRNMLVSTENVAKTLRAQLEELDATAKATYKLLDTYMATLSQVAKSARKQERSAPAEEKQQSANETSPAPPPPKRSPADAVAHLNSLLATELTGNSFLTQPRKPKPMEDEIEDDETDDEDSVPFKRPKLPSSKPKPKPVRVLVPASAPREMKHVVETRPLVVRPAAAAAAAPPKHSGKRERVAVPFVKSKRQAIEASREEDDEDLADMDDENLADMLAQARELGAAGSMARSGFTFPEKEPVFFARKAPDSPRDVLYGALESPGDAVMGSQAQGLNQPPPPLQDDEVIDLTLVPDPPAQ